MAGGIEFLGIGAVLGSLALLGAALQPKPAITPNLPAPTGQPRPGGPNPSGQRQVPATPPVAPIMSFIPPYTPPDGFGTANTCLTVPPGNTVLDFQVGWEPDRVLGTPVIFWGTLYWVFEGDEGLTTRVPVKGAVILFVDPAVCGQSVGNYNQPVPASIFQSCVTDDYGNFVVQRPLQPDELDGYQVFAYYAGDSLHIGPFSIGVAEAKLDPYLTGTWTVIPV